MATRLLGYNVAVKINGKTCVGRTQDDLTITPNVKESITKDDNGQKQFSVTGQEVTIKVSGLMCVDNSDSGKLDNDDLIEQSLKTGSAAETPLTYQRTGGDSYSGTAIMTSYTESTNSEDEGTWTADFKITGAFSKVVQGGSNPQ